jgi:lipopolysaccharide biosynthesis regulator YciM
MVLLGDLEAQQGNLAAAVEAWQRIESQNPAYLSLVAERLADAYRRQGSAAQALRVLKAYQQQYPSLDLLNTVFSLTLAEEGPAAAGALIKDELARNPTLLGLDRLLEAQLLAAPAERRHDLELVKQLVGQHIKRLGMYKCDHCGFRARQYYWRCPGCGKWETYSPHGDTRWLCLKTVAAGDSTGSHAGACPSMGLCDPTRSSARSTT